MEDAEKTPTLQSITVDEKVSTFNTSTTDHRKIMNPQDISPVFLYTDTYRHTCNHRSVTLITSQSNDDVWFTLLFA